MSTPATIAADLLTSRFLLDYPREAARQLELLEPEEAAELLGLQPASTVPAVWRYLREDLAEQLVAFLPEEALRQALTELEPARAASLLRRLDTATRERCLALLAPQVARELTGLLTYPDGSAGALMDPRVITFRQDTTVQQALDRIRAHRKRAFRELYLVDDDGCLQGRVDIQDMALADRHTRLALLAQPVHATVTDLSPREELVTVFEQRPLPALPVTDYTGRLIGIIRHAALITAFQQETSADIQTMVGVSRDERARSPVRFAVTRRLPWLYVNLATAILAASVVGLFEDTIARFTALAVLMPVVAGMAGNAGHQALAVTMRGLVLREISLRHWAAMLFKEANVGLLNGITIALSIAAGVWLWSGSAGLALVIASAMVLSLIAAGLSGALIPIILRRLGQDPAQASAIFLTTITDVVGFFSFLGIATALAGLI